jgi:hypothetical protein
MACRISELVLGCRDPEVLERFWCEVLDFVVLDREDDGSVEIGPREGFGGPQPTIILSRRDEPEKGKSRLHIDVNATDRDQDAELATACLPNGPGSNLGGEQAIHRGECGKWRLRGLGPKDADRAITTAACGAAPPGMPRRRPQVAREGLRRQEHAAVLGLYPLRTVWTGPPGTLAAVTCE